MDPRRIMRGNMLLASGGGLIFLGLMVFIIKVLVELAFVVAGGLVLAGIIMFVIGSIMRRT